MAEGHPDLGALPASPRGSRLRLSVVIPTLDRKERLGRTLAALEAQRGAIEGGVEILVVDDGSSDGTRTLLAGLEKEGRLRPLSPGHGGPARARNAGAREAAGEILVFLGDDIVPEPGFLAAHDGAHRETPREPRAVLGRTDWDSSRMRVTPMLRHLGRNGLQFGYGLIRDPEDVPAWFFYASNVSLPRDSFLRLGGFDETFGAAAWEDVEFALRAAAARPPLRLVYRPEARARHDHPTTVGSFRVRQKASGIAAARLLSRHPDLASSLGVSEARSLEATRPGLLSAAERVVKVLDPLGVPLPGRVYDKLFRWDYLDGLREALSDPPAETASQFRARADGLHP